MKTFYENIIVGGGIVGAGILRDLSLHDEEVLLIDKHDFTSQTSQSSSKMLHGGIRYLENFDFSLVYEALHEKIYWTKLLPHLTKEVPFVLPIYRDSKHPKFMVKIGLFLYDFLSGFNNSPHQMLTKLQVKNKLSELNTDGLVGGGLYHDAVMDDAKITLEVIYDALINKNTYAWNYHEIIQAKKNEDYNQIMVRNRLTGETKIITCKNLIYALGPFTDQVLKKLYPEHWTPILIPSKGSHLWVRRNKLMIDHPLVINHKDGRVIFFIPSENKILIGTTETESLERIESNSIDKNELKYLLEVTNEYFPSSKVDESDVLSTFSGVRPLIRDNRSTAGKGKTARSHKTYQIGKNVFVIAGGKYTTFRVMGQEITRNIVSKKGRAYSSRKSLTPLRKTSIIKSAESWDPNLNDIENIIKNEMPKTLEDLIYRRVGVHSESEWNLLYPTTEYNAFIEKITNNFQIMTIQNETS